MLRVESFLGCFKLETGGYVIGWISFIQNILAIVGCVIGLILMSIFTCAELKEMLEKDTEVTEDPENNFIKVCGIFKGVGFVIIIIVLLLAILFVWIAFSCIKGTENRTHSRVRPMMILLAITSILCFLNILSFTSSGIISGLIYGGLYGYLFVVIYSLYATFKEEFERGGTAHYQQPGSKV